MPAHFLRLATLLGLATSAAALVEGPFFSLSPGRQWVYEAWNAYGDSRSHYFRTYRLESLDALSGDSLRFVLSSSDSGYSLGNGQVSGSGPVPADSLPIRRSNRDTGYLFTGEQKMELRERPWFERNPEYGTWLYFLTERYYPIKQGLPTGQARPGLQYLLKQRDTVLYCERIAYSIPNPGYMTTVAFSRYFQKGLGMRSFERVIVDWPGIPDSIRVRLVSVDGAAVDTGFIPRAESSYAATPLSVRRASAPSSRGSGTGGDLLLRIRLGIDFDLLGRRQSWQALPGSGGASVKP